MQQESFSFCNCDMFSKSCSVEQGNGCTISFIFGVVENMANKCRQHYVLVVRVFFTFPNYEHYRQLLPQNSTKAFLRIF